MTMKITTVTHTARPKAKPLTPVTESVIEAFDPEYDDEAGMADNNLETLRRAVEGLDDVINTGDNLPEW
jgi:hypothetical protein